MSRPCGRCGARGADVVLDDRFGAWICDKCADEVTREWERQHVPLRRDR